MKGLTCLVRAIVLLLLLNCGIPGTALGQLNEIRKTKNASKKIEVGLEKNKPDTLAQGYFDLAESLYQKGELGKSEVYYQKSRNLFEKMGDADGVAKSSRALAKVQEDQNKVTEAISNYTTAQESNVKTGDYKSNTLNTNDIGRLLKPDSVKAQERFLQNNIDLGMLNKDTGEIVSNFSRMGDLGLKNNKPATALFGFSNAYQYSRNNPEQAQRFNQQLTDVYLKENNYSKAIETKKAFLGEGYVQNSSLLKAIAITSLADVYIQKKEDSTAIKLLNESYNLSVKSGHTLAARANVEKLDSIFQRTGKKDRSLRLHRDFVHWLPGILSKDSSIADNRIVAETETRIKKLETEKILKDDLIRRKNIFAYWLIGSIFLLASLTSVVLFTLKKLRTRNRKIALQSLRREMNPHFIFNSLNSINQFIAHNNELAANQYLTKFSTLMRRVMENSKDDFVLFSKEAELLQNYLELERSRFPDKFDFKVKMDDFLLAEERLYLPCMLVQPHLENAIWHGLRYMDEKGFLQLSFIKSGDRIEITIEDNGIGIAESKKSKTENQKKRSGRGISNTLERIKILNELYRQAITCEVEDKAPPERGVKVKINVPVLKNFKHED